MYSVTETSSKTVPWDYRSNVNVIMFTLRKGHGMDAVSAGLLALAHKLVGSVMLLFGVVLFPLPIPVGLPLIALGLAFTAPYFAPSRALVRTLRCRVRLLDRAMCEHAHRCPGVVRQTIERTAPAA